MRCLLLLFGAVLFCAKVTASPGDSFHTLHTQAISSENAQPVIGSSPPVPRLPQSVGELVALAGVTSVTPVPAPIEEELIIQTPVSAFIVDAAFKEFTQYAKEKWNVTVKASALHAGTPVSYETIVKWKGKPQADIFWGGESALFDKLAAQNLVVRLELPNEVWESIPASIGKPKPVPLKDPAGYWG